MADRALTRYAWLSVGAAILTMGMKLVAWRISGSVGLLSDAAESTINLVAAVLLLFALRLAAKPADATHEHGHDKAELFSAGAEGAMIVIAAAVILASAIDRLLHPEPLEQVGLALAVSVAAAAVNGAVALVMLSAGKRHRSLALVADGRHLMTDVWTTAGVVVGVALVPITGWERLDPIVAILVGLNIVFTGSKLLWSTAQGLMDPAFDAEERAAVQAVLDRHAHDGVSFHALRTRTSGRRRFATVHVLVPGGWTVAHAHDVLEEVEAELRAAVPGLVVTTHVEPSEDARSYVDQDLDRA